MAGTNDYLRAKGVQIVALRQPCEPNAFLEILRDQYGASHRAANETMLTLIRDGHIKTNFSGKLVLRR
jgi:hypothetical protein